MVRNALLFVCVAATCGRNPPNPTESDARAQFSRREPTLRRVIDALDAGVRAADLTHARPKCVASDGACLQATRKRDDAVADARREIERVLASPDVACAEVTVSTDVPQELRAAGTTPCPPGRRGDHVAPEKGTKIGDYSVGWGVYFGTDGVMRRGIAAHRESKDGQATATVDVYFFE